MHNLFRYVGNLATTAQSAIIENGILIISLFMCSIFVANMKAIQVMGKKIPNQMWNHVNFKQKLIVKFAVNCFLMQNISTDTFIQLIKPIKITNVNIVANHFLMQEIWRYTSTQFMKATKITNVNHVANYFLEQII